MAVVFLVMCPRPPPKKRIRASGFRVRERELASDDPLPEAGWRKKVVAVIEVQDGSGASDAGRMMERLEEIAVTTGGALYDADLEEWVYLDKAGATKRAKRMLADGEGQALVAWVRAVRPHDDLSRRWETLDAIRAVVQPELERASRRKKPTAHLGALLVALHHAYDDAELEKLVLASAKHGDGHVKAAAAAIVDKREKKADSSARAPKAVAELMALFEGSAAGNPSATRRLERFLWESHDSITGVVMKAVDANYDASQAVAAHVVSSLHMSQLSPKERERLAATTHGGTLARALRDAAIAHRDAAGQRAAAYSQARFEDYERYREHELVVKPRRRGDDIAMLRGLNDALYGEERLRPQLPMRVVALVCDRRFDEARASYVEAFGETHADAAIRDAIAYFAPDLDY